MSSPSNQPASKRRMYPKEKQRALQWLEDDEKLALFHRKLSTVDANCATPAVQTFARLAVLELHTQYADRVAEYVKQNYGDQLRPVGTWKKMDQL